VTIHDRTWDSWVGRFDQLRQSNRSITDGLAVCDNHPSTTGQRTRPSCHEFGVGDEWAEILKSAMRHGWATKKKVPHTMGQPTLAGVHGTHALHPLVSLGPANNWHTLGAPANNGCTYQ
jgi:hypothetical protein